MATVSENTGSENTGQTPASSGSLPTIDAARANDIGLKQKAVAEFLESYEYDALLLQRPENLAWFTSGGDFSRSGSSETIASLFVTRDARVVITNNASSSQIFEKELTGLGFQLKERPWYEDRHVLINDVCRGRNVASDLPWKNVTDVSHQLSSLRLPLTPYEAEHIRELGKLVAHAAEATGRNFKQGMTEAEIAGQVAHRLVKKQVVPERIQVWADAKTMRYPHWSYGNKKVQDQCTISVVGRRFGLCTGVSRTVSFSKPPKEFSDAYHRAALAQATGLYFSQPDWEVFEVWNRVERIYKKYQFPDDWRECEQGEITGYHACEAPFVPKSEFRLATRMPVFWHQTVGTTSLGDTILIGTERFELLTPMESWPVIKIEVKKQAIELPGILRRDQPA